MKNKYTMKTMRLTGAILFLFLFPVQAAIQPDREQVLTICTNHYTNLVINILGALNTGMSIEDVKKNVFAKTSISKQMSLLLSLIDLLPTNKDQEKYNVFNALVDQCVVDNIPRMNVNIKKI